VAEMHLPCPTCGERVRIKLTFGAFEDTGFPISVRRADFEAAWLEHAFDVQEIRR
jgi:hypothetical protein